VAGKTPPRAIKPSSPVPTTFAQAAPQIAKEVAKLASASQRAMYRFQGNTSTAQDNTAQFQWLPVAGNLINAPGTDNPYTAPWEVVAFPHR
jgi:hypothetical protein